MTACLHMCALGSRTAGGPRPALPRASQAMFVASGTLALLCTPQLGSALVSRRPSGCSREHSPQNLLQARSGRMRCSGELNEHAAPTLPISASILSPALTLTKPGGHAGRPHLAPPAGAHVPGLLRDERVRPCRAGMQPGSALVCGDAALRVSRLRVTAGICRQVEWAHRAGFQVPSGAFPSQAPV